MVCALGQTDVYTRLVHLFIKFLSKVYAAGKQQGSLLSFKACRVYIAANRGTEKARDRGEGEKVFMILVVFVLKSSFAKRPNISIISLFSRFWLVTMFQVRRG